MVKITPNKARLGQKILNGAKGGQMGPYGAKWGQMGINKAQQGQTGRNVTIDMPYALCPISYLFSSISHLLSVFFIPYPFFLNIIHLSYPFLLIHISSIPYSSFLIPYHLSLIVSLSLYTLNCLPYFSVVMSYVGPSEVIAFQGNEIEQSVVSYVCLFACGPLS